VSLAIFALTLPVRPFFLQNILSYSTILFLIFALSRISYCGDIDFKSRYRQVLFFVAPFLWWAIGILYSSDLSRALKVLETKLVLILIPGFILLIHPISKEKLKKILFFYASGVTFFLLISYVLVLHQNYQYNQFRTLVIPFYAYHSLVHFIGMHATYMSIQVGLSILIVLDFSLSKAQPFKKQILRIVWLIFLLFALVSLTTKMVTIGLVVASTVYLMVKTGVRYTLKFIGPVLLILMLSVFYMSKHHWFKKRFLIDKQELAIDFSQDPENKNGKWGSLNMRYALAICAWDVISDKPILGTGVGDGQALRNQVYNERDFRFAINQGFNEHNQYLNTWLTSGIIGLILLLLLLMIPMYNALKMKNALYVAFITLIMISFLSENYLSRQIGVAFFAFFHSLFWQNQVMEKQTNAPKTM
jgi:hypothetical protein